MRTTKALLCAAVVAAGAVTAMAQSNVYSLNVVGYVNRTLPGTVGGVQQLAFVSNPLDTGNNVYTNLFQTLPVGTVISRWDPVSIGFLSVSRAGFGTGWSPSTGGTNVLNPGAGVFIKLPLNSTGWTNTFVGNVLQGGLTNTFLPGYSVQSYAVPVSDSVTNLGLNAAIPSSPSGSKIQLWSEATQGYLTYSRASFGSGWSPAVPSVTVGSAFFVYNSATTNRPWIYNFNVQ